jgi:hypothetical protein
MQKQLRIITYEDFFHSIRLRATISFALLGAWGKQSFLSALPVKQSFF